MRRRRCGGGCLGGSDYSLRAASSNSPEELHAQARCVVLRIVAVDALAVRHVHSPEGQGQGLPAVQSIRESGAIPEHEVIAGSAGGEISVVEKEIGRASCRERV